MAAPRPLEAAHLVSIWRKIAGVWLVLFVFGFILEREQGRNGVVDGWNHAISRAVVMANRDVLVPAAFRWVELDHEPDVRVMTGGASQLTSSDDQRIVYSGTVRDGEWSPESGDGVVAVEFSATDAEAYNQWPPGPVDYAVVLDQMNRQRCAAVGVVSPMRWWDAPEVYFHSLTSQIRQLHFPMLMSLGMTDVADLRRDGDAAPPTRELVCLPMSALSSGDPDLLVHVSGVLDPADERLGALNGVRSAFTYLSVGDGLPDSLFGRAKVPLLARTDDSLVVALPLAVVLAKENVAADEVSIVLGDAIRWRERWVPIDDHGCYDVVLAGAVHADADWKPAIHFVSPDDLESDDGGIPNVKGRIVMLARENVGIPLAGGGESSAADLLVAVTRAIDSGEHRAPTLVFTTLPAWAYWLTLLAIPVVTTVVLRLRLSRAAAAVVFLVMLAAFFLTYAQLVSAHRVLQPTATVLGVWLAGLVASFMAPKWRVTNRPIDSDRRKKMREFDAD